MSSLQSKGEQIEVNTFKLEGRYYKGRIEEARKYFRKHVQPTGNYTFVEYVSMTHENIRMPRRMIKKELIELCAPLLEPKEAVRLIYLIHQL